MAGQLTLTQARAETRGLLDNTESTRWTDTQVDSALGSALSECLVAYAQGGGDRFDLEGSVTTSATDGSASLTSLTPLYVKDVGVVVGTTCTRIDQKNTMRRGFPDLVARTLRVLYVTDYTLPTSAGHPLVGAGASAAPSWLTFDKWVCAAASYELAIKDGNADRIARLEAFAAQKKRAALERPSIPSSSPWPRPEYVAVIEGLRWTWVPTATLYLVRERW